MGFHLRVVAFMAFEHLRIVDGPRLLIFASDKGDLVTFYFDRTFDTLKRKS